MKNVTEIFPKFLIPSNITYFLRIYFGILNGEFESRPYMLDAVAHEPTYFVKGLRDHQLTAVVKVTPGYFNLHLKHRIIKG